jgi:hypothetical protein
VFPNQQFAKEDAAFDFILKHLGKSSEAIQEEGMNHEPKFARQLIRDAIEKNIMAGRLFKVNKKIERKDATTKPAKKPIDFTSYTDTPLDADLIDRLVKDVANGEKK